MDNSRIKKKEAPHAYKLVTKCPNLKQLLDSLAADISITTTNVGRKFDYPSDIIRYKLYGLNGMFYKYFIRKVLSHRFQFELRDSAAERILANINEYFTTKISKKILPRTFEMHYNIFKNSNNRPMDIIESIKIVSLAPFICYNKPLPANYLVDTNRDNLLEVAKYFEKLSYSKVEMKCNVDLIYFVDSIDLIFDQKVLYEIKTSKYPIMSAANPAAKIHDFYKLILLSFGYYKKTNRVCKCFKMYNPLLGVECEIEMENINMEHIEYALSRDLHIITNNLLAKSPDLTTFLKTLTKDVDIKSAEVGGEFEYPAGVIENNLYGSYAIFLKYFIRKVLSQRFQTELKDYITEFILKHKNSFFTEEIKKKISPEELERHYNIFTDLTSQAMVIIESIKIVSLAPNLYYHDPLPECEVDTNDDNLFEIIKYFGNLPYSEVETKSYVDTDCFISIADIVFNQKVVYKIQASQSSSDDQELQMQNFFELILFGFGYYKKTGKVINCFKIYNPLLGRVCEIEINNINMNAFEKVINEDMWNLWESD